RRNAEMNTKQHRGVNAAPEVLLAPRRAARGALQGEHVRRPDGSLQRDPTVIVTVPCSRGRRNQANPIVADDSQRRCAILPSGNRRSYAARRTAGSALCLRPAVTPGERELP